MNEKSIWFLFGFGSESKINFFDESGSDFGANKNFFGSSCSEKIIIDPGLDLAKMPKIP